MTVRFFILILLFVLAFSVYISLSGAPFRVKAVHTISWIVILCVAAGIFWSSGIAHKRKPQLLLVVILVGAFAYLVLVNRVVLKFGAFSAPAPFVRSYALYVLLVAFGVAGMLATTTLLDNVSRRLSGNDASLPRETK